MPVDDEGLDVAALPPAARLVYVTPSHQFPLGTPMSATRRTALLAWAARHGAVIVEDDSGSTGSRHGSRTHAIGGAIRLSGRSTPSASRA
ncbi:hypothetical protein NE236_04080 [Actinoallomurus purpureus]|uniref:hypothetical protein n=1 Tax=Actinoallomurus purpureus TaxID=478114 RepID=UPI0020920C7B|nr:hypothetical protein [Actinoallomurus purpureus]MCO6004149.1 hypothetical protein [Actinoallomurus purpureus]